MDYNAPIPENADLERVSDKNQPLLNCQSCLYKYKSAAPNNDANLRALKPGKKKNTNRAINRILRVSQEIESKNDPHDHKLIGGFICDVPDPWIYNFPQV